MEPIKRRAFPVIAAAVLALVWLMTYSACGAKKGTDGGGMEVGPGFEGLTVVKARKFILGYLLEGENLRLRVVCPSTGWLAVGLKPTKKMKGADIIIGCATDSSSVVSDHFAVGTVKHVSDEEAGGRYTLVKAECGEKEGRTSLDVTLPLDSGDPADVRISRGEKVRVILAAGEDDDISQEHETRVGLDIQL